MRRYTLYRFVLLVLLVVPLMACAHDDSKASGPSAPPRQDDDDLAAVVNGQPITMAEFERERARRTAGLDIQPADAAAFDAYVLETMIEQVLIAQAAERLEIEVTEDEVDAELAEQALIATEAGVSLDEFVASQLYTMDDYRAAVGQLLLAQKVSAAVVDVPPTATQIHSRHILVADEKTALMLLEQLNSGANFAELARQYSLDKTTAPNGGDLDWISEGDLLQPEVERVIFAMPPQTRTATPVKSSLGYHIIEVLERRDDGQLSAAALARKKQQAFMAWLQAEMEAAEIERYIGS